MVGLTDLFKVANQAEFLKEIEEALQSSQPNLSARAVNESIAISGTIICKGSEGPFDAFDILIRIAPGFPAVEPVVWEISERIPRSMERHVYPENGQCCICIWEEWMWDIENPSFQAFLDGPLHSYFVSQSIFEMTNDWPFGDRRHGKPGLLDAYRRILALPEEADVESYIKLLSMKVIKGHNYCPCGSGQRIRNCHREAIIEMKSKIPDFLIQRMAIKLQALRRIARHS